jgi:hypothetical protein
MSFIRQTVLVAAAAAATTTAALTASPAYAGSPSVGCPSGYFCVFETSGIVVVPQGSSASWNPALNATSLVNNTTVTYCTFISTDGVSFFGSGVSPGQTQPGPLYIASARPGPVCPA